MARRGMRGSIETGFLVALAVAGGMLVAFLMLPRGSTETPASRSSPAPHFVEPDADLRTVVVSRVGMADPSEPEAPLRAQLLEGQMPGGPTTAEVLSDENCEPDAMGISHCLNRMQLPDGSEIAVRHNHRMSEVSCLSPGEMVNLETA